MNWKQQIVSLAPILRLVWLVACAGCLLREKSDPPGRLEIAAPTRMKSGLTSSNSELCARLKATLSFDRVDDLGPPPIDAVELVPKTDSVCAWVLSEPRELLAGSYDLVVRFVTRNSEGSCNGSVLAGAYLKRGIAFPFAEDFAGLSDADFLSRSDEATDGRWNGEAVDFNLDDDARDNLAELSAGSDPCHENSVPTVTLSGLPGSAVPEGTRIPLMVSSVDADDIPHRLIFAVRHGNGAQFPPESATFTALSNSGDVGVVAPDLLMRGWAEEWSISSSADLDLRPGSGLWSLELIAEEPFVGALTVQVIADDGVGTVLSGSDPAALMILEDAAADPPLLLLEGATTPVTALQFAEQQSPPDERRFTIVDRNLGSPVSTLAVELRAGSAPNGVALRSEAGTAILSWSPTNAQAISPTSTLVPLDLFDGGHVKRNEVSVEVQVSPLLNDAPIIEAPRPQYLALPGQVFQSALVPFFVDDPDQVDAQPVCTIPTIAPSGSTSCATPFTTVSCAVTGPRSGARWPLAITLVPSPSYASCGVNPAFSATIHVQDVPPAGAANGALDHQISIMLRTAEAMVPSIVENGPAGAGLASPNALYIDGVMKRAIVAHANGVTLVDLANPAQGYLKVYNDTSEVCVNGTFDPSYAYGAVDELNHRVMLMGNVRPAGSCDSGIAIFDLQTQAVVTHDLTGACGAASGGLGDLSNPVVDPASGSFYFLCDTTSDNRVVRWNAAGQRAEKVVPSFSAPFVQSSHAAVVAVPGGTSWLVLVAQAGFFAMDLATFDSATPTTVNVPHSSAAVIDERVVDSERGDYLFIYESSDIASIARIRFASGAPVAEAPLVLGASRYSSDRSLTLRRPFSAGATPAPHLVASLGEDIPSAFYDVVSVDLDTWSITQTQSTMMFDFGSRSHRFWATADRRYFLQTMYTYAPLGMFLHPFDGSMSTWFPHPDLQSKVWVVETSYSGNLTLVSAERLIVLDFPEAALNLDQ